MIEIIKDNTKEKFYTLCENCLSELEYEYADVSMTELPFSYIPDRHIICPVCGKETFAGLKTKDDYTFDTNHFKFSAAAFNNACCCDTKQSEVTVPD